MKVTKEQYRIYYLAHLDECRAWEKEWRQEREAIRLLEKPRPMTDPQKDRAKRLRAKYGLTLADFHARLVGQGMTCAICKNAAWRDRPQVDHDHRKRKVRGILCGNCNVALGLIHDDPATARTMAEYLDRAGRRQRKAAGT